MNITSLFRRIGIFMKATRSEIDEADAENISRSTIEHRRAVERSAVATVHFIGTSWRLRENIKRSRISFADMETCVHRSTGRRRQG